MKWLAFFVLPYIADMLGRDMTFFQFMFLCLFDRCSIKQLLGHEFFLDEASAFNIRLKVSKTTDAPSTLLLRLEVDDGGNNRERTLVEFKFDLRSDSPEEVARDMVSTRYALHSTVFSPLETLCVSFLIGI